MANASHGNRPDFLSAENPDIANQMYLCVAEELKKFADILEKEEDFNTALNDLLKKTIKNT